MQPNQTYRSIKVVEKKEATDWQNEPITEKQSEAIRNTCDQWNITIKAMPKTKGEAKAAFKGLSSMIAQIRILGIGDDYLDPIF